MPTSDYLRLHDNSDVPEPIPFQPHRRPTAEHGANQSPSREDLPADLSGTTDDVFETLNTMSRKIDDLARELNCFGFFGDDDDDRPRAA